MKIVVAIVGPTAIGKTELALSLARTFNGEIVNADSRQVYRYMDIGTAKPGPQELESIPHHLIDIVDPDEDFNLALYQPLAYGAIEDIQKRGKLPLLVGGSGLYVWSVSEGWQIPRVSPDPALRRQLEDRAAGEGVDELYQELQRIDPVAAGKIDRRNVRRVIRALEVCQATGSFSQFQGKKPPGFETLVFGMTTDRDELYRRIDQRVDKMIERGLVAEVKDLTDRGYGFELPAMSSVGYKQIGRFIQGELELSVAVQQIKYETHRFARHQYAWFRLDNQRIRWFNIQGQVEENIIPLMEREIARC
jgi:tRNA dimethylallyltransferase